MYRSAPPFREMLLQRIVFFRLTVPLNAPIAPPKLATFLANEQLVTSTSPATAATASAPPPMERFLMNVELVITPLPPLTNRAPPVPLARCVRARLPVNIESTIVRL